MMAQRHRRKTVAVQVTAEMIAAFAESLGADAECTDPGLAGATVQGPSRASVASEGHVAYIRDAGAQGLSMALASHSTVLIMPADLRPQLSLGLARDNGIVFLLWATNPRLVFIRVITRFFDVAPLAGVSPTAQVSGKAVLGADVFIGPGVTVGDSTIGAGSVLHAGCHICDGAVLGERVTVQAGAVIGSDGFGYERDENGVPVRFPHLGAVVIGDDVEIGANSVVDRGTLGDTRVGDRTKIDNLCHIAHNVTIGADVMIAAGAMIAGSTALGNRVWVGPQAAVSDGIRIGDDAYISLGAVVTRDVEAAGRVSGNFAVDHDRFLRHMRGIR
jgi:UDP-3-O-[3-hydroxymyristoyl] glucosamine N-acyltransferase